MRKALGDIPNRGENHGTYLNSLDLLLVRSSRQAAGHLLEPSGISSRRELLNGCDRITLVYRKLGQAGSRELVSVGAGSDPFSRLVPGC